VRFIDIKGLVRQRDRIRRIDIAERPEGTILGVLAGDGQRTHTIHWLRLSDGLEILRRSVPVYDRSPAPALSPDLSLLAYTERADAGESIILERPLEPQRPRRAIPLPPDPYGIAYDPEAPPRCRYLALNCDGGMLRASLENIELVAWNIRDAFNCEAEVPITEYVFEEYPIVRAMAHARPASLGGVEVHVVACEMAMIYLCRPGLAGMPVNDETGGEPRAVAFSPDGTRLAVAVDNRLTLWNTATVANYSSGVTFVPHEGPITVLAFSPDGRTIATASTDGCVLFWGVDGSGSCSATEWRIGSVGGVVFSPDGCACIAGGEGGRLVVRDLVEDPATLHPCAPAATEEPGATATWVTAENFNFPPNVAVVGHEVDGTPLYAARGFYRNNLLLGRVRPGLAGAILGYKNREMVVAPFEVLVGPLVWRPGSGGHMPRHAVPCGHDSRGRPFYLVRARIAGGLYPGRIGPGLLAALLPFDGVEFRSPEYEVLVRAQEGGASEEAAQQSPAQ
jgi:hypothetical protein